MLCFFFFNDTATTEIYTLSYTTLFRSLADSGQRAQGDRQRDHHIAGQTRRLDYDAVAWQTTTSASAQRARAGARSEEHTSELQSRLHLVCRLLLEKKKTSLSLTESCVD